MIGFSNAKINIGLSVLDKRSDGYHNIESIFYPLPFFDVIEIMTAPADSFHSYNIPLGQKNLITAARDLLRENYEIPPVSIHIYKQIPLGSGLGGGSSNAVTVLKMLNQLFNLQIDENQLFELALQLGSDCPFFIRNKVSFVSGRGEIVKEFNLDLSDHYIQIIHPDIHISTAEAFTGLEKSKLKPNHWKDWKLVQNHFEDHARNQYPIINKLLNQLENSGAIYSSLTGTGAAVYGIFETAPKNDLGGWILPLK